MFQLTLTIQIPCNTYTMITISDSIIDTPMASSSWRVDTMPKNASFDRITPFFDIISSFPHEVTVGVSMMLSDIVLVVY